MSLVLLFVLFFFLLYYSCEFSFYFFAEAMAHSTVT